MSNYIVSRADTSGYVALMATIIIGVILLIVSVGSTQAGWHARFIILGTEAKEQSVLLTQGCADQALAQLLGNASYQGNTTTTVSVGTCHVFPLALNTPLAGIVTLQVQGRVRDAFTNLEMQIDMKDVRINSVPLPEPVIIPLLPLSFDIHLNSWKELPTLP